MHNHRILVQAEQQDVIAFYQTTAVISIIDRSLQNVALDQVG